MKSEDDITWIKHLLEQSETGATAPAEPGSERSADEQELQNQLHFLTRALSQGGRELWAEDPAGTADDRGEVLEILNRTAWVRRRRWGLFAYQRWMPAAAMFLLITNIWLFLELNPSVNAPVHNDARAPATAFTPPTIPVRATTAGTVFSRSPTLMHPWEEGNDVLVEITSDPLSRVFRTRKKVILWEETGLEPLVRGKVLKIRFRIGPEDRVSPVYVLSESEAQELDERLKGAADDLERARILHENRCYSEAMVYMSRWKNENTATVESLALLKDCYQAMGFHKEAAKVQGWIQEIQDAAS